MAKSTLSSVSPWDKQISAFISLSDLKWTPGFRDHPMTHEIYD